MNESKNEIKNCEEEVFEDALEDFESLNLNSKVIENKNICEDSEKKNIENLENILNFKNGEEENLEKESIEVNSDNKDNELIEEKLKKSLKLKEKGNFYFKNLDFENSITLYNQALDEIPKRFIKDRAILYNNRAASKFNLYENILSHDKTESENESEKKHTKSKLDDIIDDLTKSIELDNSYLKPYLKRAKVYHLLGEESLDLSLEDYKKSLELSPKENTTLTQEISEEINEISQKIELRNEKLKKQMVSSLKDLGNTFLNCFGLSTDNFKIVENKDTGGYQVVLNK